MISACKISENLDDPTVSRWIEPQQLPARNVHDRRADESGNIVVVLRSPTFRGESNRHHTLCDHRELLALVCSNERFRYRRDGRRYPALISGKAPHSDDHRLDAVASRTSRIAPRSGVDGTSPISQPSNQTQQPIRVR